MPVRSWLHFGVRVGGNRPLLQLCRVLTRDGTLVGVGDEGGGRCAGGLDRQLRAMVLSPFVRQRLGTFIANENSPDLDALRALIATGAGTPVIHRVVALHQVPDAIRDLAAGHVRNVTPIRLRGRAPISRHQRAVPNGAADEQSQITETRADWV